MIQCNTAMKYKRERCNEYQSGDIHTHKTTEQCKGNGYVIITSPLTHKSYQVQMEFTGTISQSESESIGEEIRTFLKQKCLQKNMEKIGSVQMKPSAVQSLTQVEIMNTGEEKI